MSLFRVSVSFLFKSFKIIWTASYMVQRKFFIMYCYINVIDLDVWYFALHLFVAGSTEPYQCQLFSCVQIVLSSSLNGGSFSFIVLSFSVMISSFRKRHDTRIVVYLRRYTPTTIIPNLEVYWVTARVDGVLDLQKEEWDEKEEKYGLMEKQVSSLKGLWDWLSICKDLQRIMVVVLKVYKSILQGYWKFTKINSDILKTQKS